MNSISKFAPVLIITLNRDEHFINCVDSLSECLNAKHTDLYIALDFPLFDRHWEGYLKIVDYISTIKGFKSVTVIRREKNYGIKNNYMFALDFVFEKYDRIVFSEDDNVFSIDFLNYMNECLEKFKNRRDIFSISGYNYPIQMPFTYTENIYLWQGHSAWGVGFWRDKYMKIDWNEDVIEKTIRDFFMDLKKVKEFNQIANIYIPTLMDMIEKKLIHGDAYICLYQFLNNMVSVFPTVSRARNLGQDGSGANCAIIEDNIYAKQEIFEGKRNYEISNIVTINPEISKLLKLHFNYPFKAKLKLFIKLLLMNIQYLQKK